MKKLVVTFTFLFSVITYAQQNNYVDSIQQLLPTLTKKKQLHAILNIPYDAFIGNVKTSEKLASKAIVLAQELNDLPSLGEAHLLLYHANTFQDKRELKVKNILTAIRIFESINAHHKIGEAYGELGYQLKRENLPQALYYMRKGIAQLKKASVNYKQDVIFDNYGILQAMLQQFDSALYYHNKSLQIKKKNNDSIGIPYGYVHLATVNMHLKNYDIAKTYIDSANIIRTKRKDIYGITDNLLYYGDLYFAQQQYARSLVYFKQGFTLAKENNFMHLKKYCAEHIMQCYLALNNFKEAFTYNNIYQTLKDSTLNLKTNAKVAQLQVEFETEKKEKEIALQKEKILQQQLHLKNRTLYGLLIGSGLLIFGLISFGLFKRNQQKKLAYKNQLALQEILTYSKLQDQRLRISRDLHDNIGSQLTFIISSLNNLMFTMGKNNHPLTQRLKEVNNLASHTISQLRDTIWAMNKSDVSFDDLLQRILVFIEKAKQSKNNIVFEVENKITTNHTFTSIKAVNILRVIQEAVTNAIKYAEAEKISIYLKEDTNAFFIEIKDNGKGFNKNKQTNGNGLSNMKSRISQIGGSFKIISKTNNGTCIIISCKK